MLSRTAIIAVVGIVLIVGTVGAFVLLSPGSVSSPERARETSLGVHEIEVLLIEERLDLRRWEPSTITVRLGDTVRLRVINLDAENPQIPTFHRLAIPDFGVDSGDILPNEAVTVEFVADKVGRFIYSDPRPREIVGAEDVRHSDEIGLLIVEP